MSQVNFYLIAADNARARLAFVCRLIEKIYRKSHQIHIHTDHAVQARLLDQLLWTERADSFIPHQLASEANPDCVPVIIGCDSDQPKIRDTLINLAGSVPAFTKDFNKVAEVISQEPEVLQLSRQRYRDYQAQGHDIIIHDLKNQEKTHG